MPKAWIPLVLVFAGVNTCAWAETGIFGAVADPQGKAVPAAMVRLFHGSGVLVMETKTDDTGTFAFPNVAPGDYRIKAAAAGFNTISKDLVLVPDQQFTANLQFGAVEGQSQSVVITAKVLEPTLDLRNSEVFTRTLFSRDDQVFQRKCCNCDQEPKLFAQLERFIERPAVPQRPRLVRLDCAA